jgi:hypothetical protein
MVRIETALEGKRDRSVCDTGRPVFLLASSRFDGFEDKGQLLSAHYVTEVLFPKLSYETESRQPVVEIDQILNSEHLPDRRQLNVFAFYSKSGCRVVVSVVRRLKIAERVGIQVPFVCGVLPGNGVAVMGSDDDHAGLRLGDPVYFLHHCKDGVQVLDHVDGVGLVKGVVLERVWVLIEVVHDVDAGERNPINADGIWMPGSAAAEFQDLRPREFVGASHDGQSSEVV